ncbi:hypothetical protein WJX75_008643 [Coccomyxa subellipsoidea]|uniref:Uncharacterized protein n=1 Tax=Coccomyxa subellipsoidea TaxID=248742 RepID=A0ABR2YIH2_9CHLO
MDGTQVLATVEERGDLMRLLESAWFGLEEALLSEESRSTAGPMVSDLVLRKAAAGEELRRQNRRHSRQHRSTPMANLSLHRCEGVPSSGQPMNSSARKSPADQGVLHGGKHSSSSPNTPLSDRLLSHSEASASDASLRLPPALQQTAAGHPSLLPEQALSGVSPASSPSGSLSDASITLCMPSMRDQSMLHGGIPSTNFLAATRGANTTPSVRSYRHSHSQERRPMPLQDRGYTGALETTQQQRRPSALTSAIAAAAACCSPSEQRRPMSLLSMQLRDSSRATSQTRSQSNSTGRPSRRGLPPRAPGRPAFWLSASAGAQPPLLAAAAADDERAREAAPARPLGRHALRPPHQSEVMRPRLVHLLRTRTCPEPLPPHSSPGKDGGARDAVLGSWAGRMFVHRPQGAVW